jgi:hypothetical protein
MALRKPLHAFVEGVADRRLATGDPIGDAGTIDRRDARLRTSERLGRRRDSHAAPKGRVEDRVVAERVPHTEQDVVRPVPDEGAECAVDGFEDRTPGREVCVQKRACGSLVSVALVSDAAMDAASHDDAARTQFVDGVRHPRAIRVELQAKRPGCRAREDDVAASGIAGHFLAVDREPETVVVGHEAQ